MNWPYFKIWYANLPFRIQTSIERYLGNIAPPSECLDKGP